MGMSAAHCQGISECLESGHPVTKKSSYCQANGKAMANSQSLSFA